MVENQELLDVCTCQNCALHALFLGWLRVKICQLLAKTASDEIKQVKRSKTKGVTPTLNGYSNQRTSRKKRKTWEDAVKRAQGML